MESKREAMGMPLCEGTMVSRNGRTWLLVLMWSAWQLCTFPRTEFLTLTLLKEW